MVRRRSKFKPLDSMITMDTIGKRMTRRESRAFSSPVKRIRGKVNNRTFMYGKFGMRGGLPEHIVGRSIAITPNPRAVRFGSGIAAGGAAAGISYAVVHHQRKKAMQRFSKQYESDPKYRASVNAKLGQYRRGSVQPLPVRVGQRPSRHGGVNLSAHDLHRYNKRIARQRARTARHVGNRRGNMRHDSRGRFT